MDKFAQFITLALMALSSAQASPALHSIEVVFNEQTPIRHISDIQTALQAQGVTLALYNLDAPAQLNKRLGQGLPGPIEQAKKIVLQRLHQDGSAALNARYQTAYQALNTSLDYGLDRFPAIVFNHGQAVVYGVTDLALAVRLFQQGQARP